MAEEEREEDKVKDARKSASEPTVSAGQEMAEALVADGQVGTVDGEGKPVALKPVKARGLKHMPSMGVAHVRATYNNTMVAIADTRGNVLAWSSSGRAGFKGSRKSTAFAAGVVGQEAARQAIGKGMKEVEVRVQGPGAGRETAIRALQSSGLTISVIKDVTPIPHNGCRQRKRRRV